MALRRRQPSWAKAGVAGLAALAVVGVALTAFSVGSGRRTTALLGKKSAEGLLRQVGGRLASDERIAEDTVRMLKAQEKLHDDMRVAGHSAREIQQQQHKAVLRARQQEVRAAAATAHGVERAATSGDGGMWIGGVKLTGAEIGRIVKSTVSRLKLRLSKVQTGHMLAAAAGEAAAGGNSTNSTDGDDDEMFPQDNGDLFDWLTPANPVLDSEETDPAPKQNYNWLQDGMTTDQLKNASEAPPGSLTAQAGEGTYDELGVEKPYLAIPQMIDVAMARSTPRWARKGYKGDPAFEMERIGEYDSHKPKWKKLVYGEAADYLKPDDKYVPVTVVRNQISPHTGFQPMDRFPKINGAAATNSSEGEGEGEGEGDDGLVPHNYRDAEEDADPFTDPRSDKEKRLLFGDPSLWSEPWKKSAPFTLADKRVKVTPNDEVGLKRFFTTGTAQRGDGGFEPRFDGALPRHSWGQEGA